jgi:hypothetical protein
MNILFMMKKFVWHVISAHKIIEPVFYSDRVNGARCVNNIQNPLFAELTEKERFCNIAFGKSKFGSTAGGFW